MSGENPTKQYDYLQEPSLLAMARNFIGSAVIESEGVCKPGWQSLQPAPGQKATPLDSY